MPQENHGYSYEKEAAHPCRLLPHEIADAGTRLYGLPSFAQ
jgi:hypothetical protein